MPELAPLDKIKVINRFISGGDAVTLVEYINFLEKTRIKDFNVYRGGDRLAFQFGRDGQYGGTPGYNTFLSLDVLKEDYQKGIIKDICKRLIAALTDLYQERDPLYVSSMWLAKQYPGCVIDPHEDTDGGYNIHFVYSGVLYLNELTDGGELIFRQLEYAHKPKTGDLVLFPTQTTGDHGVLEIPEDRYSIAFWMTKRIEMSIKGLD